MITELDLYCLCCNCFDDFNKDDEFCFIKKENYGEFVDGIGDCLDCEHTLGCDIIEGGTIAFPLNNLLSITKIDIDYLAFKNSLIKYFYEE